MTQMKQKTTTLKKTKSRLPLAERICRLPTLVVSPDDGDLQLAAVQLLTTPTSTPTLSPSLSSHGGEVMRSVAWTDDRGVILTARRQTTRKIQRTHNGEHDMIRIRNVSFPQVTPNKKVQSRKEKATDPFDHRLPNSFLPPLQYQYNEKNFKTTEIAPLQPQKIRGNRAESSSTICSTVIAKTSLNNTRVRHRAVDEHHFRRTPRISVNVDTAVQTDR
ncbi:hypothetical protein DICVIV_02675, partial [Dictyocaulus viviparus]